MVQATSPIGFRQVSIWWRISCSVGRPYAEGRALRLEIHSQNWSESRQNVELGRIQHSTKDPGDKGYSLRHLLVQTGYRLGGCTH